MGVCLDYCTVNTVEPAVRVAILEEAERRIPNREWWWCESMNLGEEVDGTLRGTNKFMRTGYSTSDGGFRKVDFLDDQFMACRDVTFIITLLTEWSERFEITWSLYCVGEPIGAIAFGICNKALGEFLNGLYSEIGFDPSDASNDARAIQISSKYADR